MITSKKITFLIQGPVENINGVSSVDLLIADINNHYPEAKCVLSTWKGMGEIVKGANLVVESEDPGGFRNNKCYLNVNRQIVSTRAAIKYVTSEYCVKIRSDLRLKNNNILKLLLNKDKFIRKSPVLMSDWVICLNFTTYNINTICKPLCFNDWLYIGKTEDINKLFSIPLYPKRFFEFYEKTPNKYGDFTQQKYNAEQWIIFQSYSTCIEIRNLSFEHGFDDNDGIVKFHNSLLANDFIVKNQQQIGVYSTKYKIYNFGMNRMMTSKDWLINYFSYVKGSRKPFLYYIPDIEKIYYSVISNKALRKCVKYMRNFIA
jgi:hypothetical protein